jgi:Holliday junction resolvase-like predicted endonuclease
VRARRPGRFGGALETIGPRKRRELEAAARAWVARHGSARDVYRFDVVAFRTPAGRAPAAGDAEHMCGRVALRVADDPSRGRGTGWRIGIRADV